MRPRKFPPAPLAASPDRPEEEVKTISFSHHIVARKDLSESTIAAFTRQLFAIRQYGDGGIPARCEDRNARHRQGCRDPGASGRRGLCRRRGKDLPRPLQRFHLVGPDGPVGDGLGRRMVRGLSEEGRARRAIHRSASGCWTCWRPRGAAIPSTNSTACRPKRTISCATRCEASSTARSRKAR